MKKKGQVDNAEEFLKLFPDKVNLHNKDMELRKRLRELIASPFHKMISCNLQIELNRALFSIKGTKSKLVDGQVGIRIYEKAVYRLDDALLKSSFSIKDNPLSENIDFEEIKKLQESLLKLPKQTLINLLKEVIASAQIEIVLKEAEAHLNADKLKILHADLKKRYRDNLTTYSLEDRQKIGKLVQHLATIKSGLGTLRTLRSYDQRIRELQLILL